MTNIKHLNEILTERDLVAAWVAMLKERDAEYCDVDLDELNYQLMWETRIHYSVKKLRHPLKEMLTHFGRTKWQWLRLERKVKAERKAAQNT
jgi:hypothetical protein